MAIVYIFDGLIVLLSIVVFTSCSEKKSTKNFVLTGNIKGLKKGSMTTLNAIEEGAKTAVRTAQKAAWADYLTPIKAEVAEVTSLFDELSGSANAAIISSIKTELNAIKEPIRREIHNSVGMTQ